MVNVEKKKEELPMATPTEAAKPRAAPTSKKESVASIEFPTERGLINDPNKIKYTPKGGDTSLLSPDEYNDLMSGTTKTTSNVLQTREAENRARLNIEINKLRADLGLAPQDTYDLSMPTAQTAPTTQTAPQVEQINQPPSLLTKAAEFGLKPAEYISQKIGDVIGIEPRYNAQQLARTTGGKILGLATIGASLATGLSASGVTASKIAASAKGLISFKTLLTGGALIGAGKFQLNTLKAQIAQDVSTLKDINSYVADGDMSIEEARENYALILNNINEAERLTKQLTQFKPTAFMMGARDNLEYIELAKTITIPQLANGLIEAQQKNIMTQQQPVMKLEQQNQQMEQIARERLRNRGLL